MFLRQTPVLRLALVRLEIVGLRGIFLDTLGNVFASIVTSLEVVKTPSQQSRSGKDDFSRVEVVRTTSHESSSCENDFSPLYEW